MRGVRIFGLLVYMSASLGTFYIANFPPSRARSWALSSLPPVEIPNHGCDAGRSNRAAIRSESWPAWSQRVLSNVALRKPRLES